MDLLNIEEVFSELNKRGLVVEKIDSVIKKFFEYSDNKEKLKRGPAQALILRSIGMTKNWRTCRLVNYRMECFGFTPIIRRGYKYYQNIKIKGK